MRIGFIISEKGENATVIGWGETTSGGSPSRILQEVNVTVISNTKCRKAYDGIKLLVNHFVNVTSLPYFGVKLSCVCLMFAYRKKLP